MAKHTQKIRRQLITKKYKSDEFVFSAEIESQIERIKFCCFLGYLQIYYLNERIIQHRKF